MANLYHENAQPAAPTPPLDGDALRRAMLKNLGLIE